MPASEMGQCEAAARQYGKRHGKSGLVEDWIKEGQDEMSPQKALEWLDSLPLVLSAIYKSKNSIILPF